YVILADNDARTSDYSGYRLYLGAPGNLQKLPIAPEGFRRYGSFDIVKVSDGTVAYFPNAQSAGLSPKYQVAKAQQLSRIFRYEPLKDRVDFLQKILVKLPDGTLLEAQSAEA